MDINIASGKFFLGFTDSLPVCAMASKPIKLENKIAAAEKNEYHSNCGSITLEWTMPVFFSNE